MDVAEALATLRHDPERSLAALDAWFQQEPTLERLAPILPALREAAAEWLEAVGPDLETAVWTSQAALQAASDGELPEVDPQLNAAELVALKDPRGLVRITARRLRRNKARGRIDEELRQAWLSAMALNETEALGWTERAEVKARQLAPHRVPQAQLIRARVLELSDRPEQAADAYRQVWEAWGALPGHRREGGFAALCLARLQKDTAAAEGALTIGLELGDADLVRLACLQLAALAPHLDGAVAHLVLGGREVHRLGGNLAPLQRALDELVRVHGDEVDHALDVVAVSGC